MDGSNLSSSTISLMAGADTFICKHMLASTSNSLPAALTSNRHAGLDEIDVAPNQGKFLYLLAKLCHASNILEVGTLGGYSALWFASAIAQSGNGKEGADKGGVITLEISEKHAAVAKENIRNAGFENLVDVRVGAALDTLATMEGEGWGSERKKMDLVFIDADKENNVRYLEYGMKFARKGAVVVVDNVGRRGKISEDWKGEDGSVEGSREVIKRMGELEREGKLEGTALQTVGSKGWDGFTIGIVC